MRPYPRPPSHARRLRVVPSSSVASAILLLLLLVLFAVLTEAVRRIPDDPRLLSDDYDHDVVSAGVGWRDEGAERSTRHGTVRHRQLERLLKNDARGAQQRDGGTGTDPTDDPMDHLVTHLPLLDDGVFPTRHFAGHVPASSDGDKKFFYWMFEPDASHMDVPPNDEDVPLLIWLNGGPGCSSMDGMFLEHGPFRMVEPGMSYPYAADPNSDADDRWRMEINPYSWHRAPAYTLYIDQPVGTGLSFTKSGKYCKNDLEVNIDFHYFLTQFLLLHRESFLVPIEGQVDGDGNQRYRLRRPLYFSGESHAGHYIPSMIDHILTRDREGDTRVHIPVAGAAIGNGWVDPYYQYAGADAAYGMGLIDLAQKFELDYREKECQAKLDSGRYSSSVCFKLLDDIIHQSDGKDRAKYKVSQYDTRLWEVASRGRSFPPGHKVVESYLGNVGGNGPTVSPPWEVDSNAVLEALHATEATAAGQVYRECTDPPYHALSHQDGLGVVHELVRVLNFGPDQDPAASVPPVQMLFFNGVTDLICNHVGNERFLAKLPWDKVDGWKLAERYVWRGSDAFNGGVPVGYMKEFDNLHFLKILNSGHMVPMDQPQVALDMISTFVYGRSFRDSAQQLGRSSHDFSECLKAEEVRGSN